MGRSSYSANAIVPDMGYLFRGILIGLLFGVPAGAVGAMTAQRAYSSGLRAGLLTGLGSSVADCIYACVGAFGLSLISDFLLAHQTIINLLGGALILTMGLGLLLKKNRADTPETPNGQRIKLFLSSFAVGITNPAAILTFLFTFSWFGLGGGMAPLDGFRLVTGVFTGTYIWWTALSAGVVAIKKRMKRYSLRTIEKCFGVVLLGFSLVVFVRAILSQ